MTSKLCRVGSAVLFLALVPFAALAGENEEITVYALGLQETRVGQSAFGAPVYDIAVTRSVDSSDLDLSTDGGLALLEARVRDAAAGACDEIERFYPNARPGKYQCVKLATQRTMQEVDERLAAL